MSGKRKTEPWRIVVGIIAIVYIIFMWIKNDILSIYSTMPKEQVASLILTTVAVIACVILLIRWIIGKFKKG